MKSPTIFDQASITSVSRRRSRNPRRCISFGISSAGDCQRSGRIFLSGKPRHSAITAARREGFIELRSNGMFSRNDRTVNLYVGILRQAFLGVANKYL